MTDPSFNKIATIDTDIVTKHHTDTSGVTEHELIIELQSKLAAAESEINRLRTRLAGLYS